MVITPQGAEHNRELAKRHKLTFDLLTDAGNEVAAAFGLRFSLPEDLRNVYRGFEIDLASFNGDESWTLPMPARFVTDTAGVIRAADVDPDYTMRPEPEDAVRAVDAL